MSVLKKIDVMSLAKVMMVLYAILGLFVGIFYYLIGLVIPMQEIPTVELYMFSPWMIIFMPIAYGLLGFVGSLIVGGLYNLIAKKVGGIKLDLN